MPLNRESGEQGSAAAGAILAALLVLLVGATVVLFASHRYDLPRAITAPGLLVDRQYDRTLYVAGVVFVLAQLGLAFAVWRFRDRGRPARFIQGDNFLEVVWTAATAIAFIGLAFAGRGVWADIRLASAGPDVIRVEVTAQQFVYNFRYPGPDGKFGRIDPSLINAAEGNPLGLDPNDPAGKDDIVSPVLTVPVGRPVELDLRSQDVIHGFFVRELRLQQDAVPGMLIPISFTANRVGRYEIVCTQLCGQSHNTMRSFLNVVPEAEYETFLKQPEPAQ
jgi:cytochrome c oxidase subunit II